MEAILAPAAPAPADFRAHLHQVIDQIQDEAVLRAALLLLLPQAVTTDAPEPELSPAWQEELRLGMQELEEGKGIPASEVFARLLPNVAV